MADAALVVPDSAVPGTKAWAETLVANAKRYAGFAEKDVRPLVQRYQALCDQRVWETWFADEPKTLQRFCSEVLGYEAEFLETMSSGVAVLDKQGFSGPVSVQAAINAVKAQAQAREMRADAIAAADQVAIALPHRIKDAEKGYNVSLPSGKGYGGNSESYLRRRLKRDHPDLYEQVDSGSMSASAAAITAGIRHRTTSVRTDDVQSAAQTLRQHFKDPEQREQLARELTKED